MGCTMLLRKLVLFRLYSSSNLSLLTSNSKSGTVFQRQDDDLCFWQLNYAQILNQISFHVGVSSMTLSTLNVVLRRERELESGRQFCKLNFTGESLGSYAATFTFHCFFLHSRYLVGLVFMLTENGVAYIPGKK